MDCLQLLPRQSRYGVGLYELGDGPKISVITDTGRVLWVSGSMIDSDDLMEAFVQGILFERHKDMPRYLDDEEKYYVPVEA